MFKKILLPVLIIIIIFGTAVYYVAQKETAVSQAITFESIKAETLHDGIFMGHYKTILISATVQLTTKNGTIESIEILEHKNGKGQDAEKIIQDILAKQTHMVDTISGATGSSLVIKKAVENALIKAIQ